MRPEANNPAIVADNIGIHFLRGGRKDIIVYWGEIESIHALREKPPNGTPFLDVYVDLISGVDFHFQSVEVGYEQVMATMEKHLMGFSRTGAEAVGSWEQEQDIPMVWQRDPVKQPFELHPLPIDNREPSDEEVLRMKAAHSASIATCEKLLGRALNTEEHSCIHTGFENGRIVGSIAFPLSETLGNRQAEILEQPKRQNGDQSPK